MNNSVKKEEKPWDNEPKYRKDTIEELLGFLKNPGFFSILLLGSRGTGKSYWLSEIIKYLSVESTKTEQKSDIEQVTINNKYNIITVNALISKNTDKDYWEAVFKKADNGFLVIDDVEELSKETQAILFEYLSTTNGKYGLEEKKYSCRIIFTSSLDIKSLRDNQRYLLNKFYDRISQLVTRFPSFSEFNSNIWKDFKKTWDKMAFKENKVPNTLKIWMEGNSHKFHGNFRDLDKLAINWNNCKLIGMNDEDTFEKVTNDFFKLFHFPEHKSENEDAFPLNIDTDDNYTEIMKNFKAHLKAFAKRKYGKLSKAKDGKPLGVSYRTMEAW